MPTGDRLTVNHRGHGSDTEESTTADDDNNLVSLATKINGRISSSYTITTRHRVNYKQRYENTSKYDHT